LWSPLGLRDEKQTPENYHSCHLNCNRDLVLSMRACIYFVLTYKSIHVHLTFFLYKSKDLFEVVLYLVMISISEDV